jgi:pimeloyl-CoA dehydrogenase small subunit
MDFEFTEEQRLLKDSVERLLKDRYDFEQRKAYMKEPNGFGRAPWKQYADLGLLGLPFDEAHGGSGGGPVETMIVAEAFGRALALEPYLATVVLAGGLLRHAGSAEQQKAILPKIADGSLLLAFAHTERQARYDLADVATTAKRDGQGYVLDGQKSVVLSGDAADKLIVSARVSGNRRDRDGLALFIIDAGAPGVTRRDYATMDGLRAADVTLAGVKAGPEAVLGQAGAALPLIERVADEAMAALAAEAVGAMAAMHELTVDYLRTRKQFGVPIGSFQVLQHRAVDMFVALEQARSMAMLATMMTAEENAAERRKAISAAKVQIGRSGRIVGQGAVQLHGGIGMTMEYKVGHYFKRVTAIDTTFGDADHHLGLLAQSDGLVPPLK